MLVSLESIEPRIAEDFSESGATQAVAIMPALDLPYNPAVPDLNLPA